MGIALIFASLISVSIIIYTAIRSGCFGNNALEVKREDSDYRNYLDGYVIFTKKKPVVMYGLFYDKIYFDGKVWISIRPVDFTMLN